MTGFWTQTEQGHTAHIKGDPNMDEKTLAALHAMIDAANTRAEATCTECGRTYMALNIDINAEEKPLICTGCETGLRSDAGRLQIENELAQLHGEKKLRRLIQLFYKAVYAIDECHAAGGGGGAIMDAKWLVEEARRTVSHWER